MKKIIIVTTSLLFAFSCFANSEGFTCDKKTISKIKNGDKSTIESFLNAAAEYNAANEELTKRIEKQELLKGIFNDASSLGERNSKFIPKNESTNESLKETRETLTSLENDQNKNEAIALQEIYAELAPCESAYLGE